MCFDQANGSNIETRINVDHIIEVYEHTNWTEDGLDSDMAPKQKEDGTALYIVLTHTQRSQWSGPGLGEPYVKVVDPVRIAEIKSVLDGLD